MASSSPPAPPVVVVGADLGALSTKLTLGPHYDHELVRNAHGGHSAPTAVTFPGQHRARLVGEDAADIARGDGNTVAMLDRLLAGSLDNDGESNGAEAAADELAAFRRFELRPSEAPNDEPKVRIPSMDEEYPTVGLLAALLGRVRRNALATIARLDADKPSAETQERELHFVFAVPASYPPLARAAVTDAAYAAGIERSSVVDAARCLAAVYAKKFGDADDEEGEKKVILVVEMGHARTSVSVLKKLGKPDEVGSDVEVLSTVASPTLGAGLIDVALYRHFLSTHPKLAHHSNDAFKDNSRAAQRLLEGCKKLKHLLSMLPENTVTVENVGQNDTDVALTADRELLRKLCEGTVLARLQSVIGSAMAKAAAKAGGAEALGEIASIEITGGGTRVPMVQDCIRAAAGKGGDFALSKSLDDTSLAFGASLVGAASASEEDGAMDAARIERRAKLREAEAALSERDARLIAKDECRNKIEAHILELRSARHATHGDLLPTSDEFTSFLDGTDDWLFSEECDGATLEQMEQKWTDVEATTQAMCGEYLAAKKAAAEKKDREMEAEALRAAAAAAANGEGDDDADHDTRRLPTKRRMEIVLKNKAEANELFADGNYRHAAARYAKALTHATKFFDLSPEEAEEVKEVKLSLHLNLALAYLKLEKLDHAHRCCNDALALDEANVKALYRRATVLYQKRKFDDATKDLDAAEKLAPDDKAVKKLRKLVDQQVAKQKKKERAFAKKMFA